MITIIAAVTPDRYAIGRRGDLLYHVSADLRHFEELTMGGSLVMGRKTFESLPKGALPGRRNIVVTRRPGYSAPGIETASDLPAALSLAASDGREVFVIGGGEVYRQAFPLADRLCLTEIHAPTPPDADTFLDRPDPAVWVETSRAPRIPDDRTGLEYSFVTYGRKICGAGALP